MTTLKETAVLHAMLQPITGPWSVMRELARAQAGSGLFAGVGVGLILYPEWPEVYFNELRGIGVPYFIRRTPRMPGTLVFVRQRIFKPPIHQWVSELAAKTGARRVVVHFHNAWLTGAFVPLRASSVPAAAVATFHGVNAYFTGQPVRRMIHRWFSRRLIHYQTTLTSVDAFNIPVIEKILGIPTAGIRVIPNGVTRTAARGCAWATRQPGDARPFRIAYVGGLTDAKGWRTSVAAAVELAQAGRPVEILLAGGGEGVEDAKRLAAEHPNVVKYFGLVSDPRQVVMVQADVLTLMAGREGLPMVIIEALSAGVPVISTRAGGIPEAIEDGVNGLLITHDREMLKQALVRLMDDPALLGRMSAESLATFERRYNITSIVNEYAEVYGGAGYQ